MDPQPEKLAFVIAITDASDVIAARLLISSIRAFAGDLKNQPILVYSNLDEQPDIADEDRAQLFLVDPAEVYLGYPLGAKVFYCSKAERELAGRVSTMVYLDPCALILRPPMLFETGHHDDACIRPVHLKNVGQPSGQALSAYWRWVYDLVGNGIPDFRVTSYVDGCLLFPYYNTHCFSVKPELGLCQHWADLFAAAVKDNSFQRELCTDFPHRIFLHQVIFSCLLAGRLGKERIHILPIDYSYPYHLHAQVPPDLRSASLNDLTHVVYEESNLSPLQMHDIEINEPLKTWLSEKWVKLQSKG